MATAGNTCFIRSFLLHQEGGLYITRKILEREKERQKGKCNLTTLLKNCENKLQHEFHGKQYQKLFPQYGNTDIYKWDLQLLVGVLINVFGHTLTNTEKKNLRSLKALRNDIFMHCASPSLNQNDYEDVQEELKDVISSLAETFDEDVKKRCSRLISQFSTGPLDGVRPSIATLNGFSQACQKKFKVGVHVELIVGGPSDQWSDLCERILDKILNNAVNRASEGADVEEIEEKVEKMLNVLLANKDVVYKGSKMECVVMCFECNSYDDFLQFVEMFDRQELQIHMDMISEALKIYYKLTSPVHISCRVRTECLQVALTNVISYFGKESVNPQLEMTSKGAFENTESLTQHMLASDEELCNKTESNQLLRLELECLSSEGLSHILSSFQKEEFSDHLTSVADALSRHVGQKIALKASLNVQDVIESIGESAESEMIDLKERIVKLYPILKEELYVDNIAYHLRHAGFLLLSELEDVRSKRTRSERVDSLLKKVLNGPIEMQGEFVEALKLYGFRHLAEIVENSTVSFEDLNADSEFINLRERLVEKYPILKEKLYVEGMANHLRDRNFLSRSELQEACAQKTRSETIGMLLKKVVNGPHEMQSEFMKALRLYGFEPLAEQGDTSTVSSEDLIAESEMLKLRLRLKKQYQLIKEELDVEVIAYHLQVQGCLSLFDVEDVCSQRTRGESVDILFQKVLKRPIKMQSEFMRALRLHGYEHLAQEVENSTVNLEDLDAATEIINLRERLVKRFPILKEKLYMKGIANHLRSRDFLSFSELQEARSQKTRSDAIDMLLKKVLNGPKDMQIEFMRAIKLCGSGHSAEGANGSKLSFEKLIADSEMLNLRLRLVNQYPFLRMEHRVDEIVKHLQDTGCLSLSELEDVRSTKTLDQRWDILFQKVLKGPINLQREFMKAIRLYGSKHMADAVENSKVSFKDFIDDMKVINLRARLVKQFPIIKEELYAVSMNDHLESLLFESSFWFNDVHFPGKRHDEYVDSLFQRVLIGPIGIQSVFMRALRHDGFGHLANVVESSTLNDEDLMADSEFINQSVRLLKQYPILKEELHVENISVHLRNRSFITLSDFENVCSQETRGESVDILFHKVLNGSIRMKSEFLRVLGMYQCRPKSEGAKYIHWEIYLTAFSKLKSFDILRVRLVQEFPFLKEELFVKPIASHLRDQGVLSFYEYEDVHSQVKRSKMVDMLLQKVLEGPDKRLVAFMEAIRLYDYKYVADVIEKFTVSEDFLDFKEPEQFSELKCARPDGNQQRIQFSEASRQILVEHLSSSVIEKISDHLLSKLIFSTVEHSDILFPTKALQIQTIFLETLEKCSKHHYTYFCELLNSFGLSYLLKELERNYPSNETSTAVFEKSLVLPREMNVKAKTRTEVRPTFKLNETSRDSSSDRGGITDSTK